MPWVSMISGIASMTADYERSMQQQSALQQRQALNQLGQAHDLRYPYQLQGYGSRYRLAAGTTLAQLCAQADSTGELHAQNPRRQAAQSADVGNSDLRRDKLNALDIEELQKRQKIEAKREEEKRRFVDATSQRIAIGQDRLSMKNSPLFGEPMFGRWCRWNFHNPFKGLEMWLYRLLRTRTA